MDAAEALLETETQFAHLLLEVLEGELVAVGHGSVAFGELLDCVVGEVHEGVVGGVGAGVLEGAEPHVALLEDVALEVVGDEHPDADVELAVHDEHGTLEVLLDQKAVGLDDGGAARDDPDVLVAVEEGLLLALAQLTVRRVAHHHRLPDLLAVAFDIVHGHLVVHLFLLLPHQGLLHIPSDIIVHEFI